jgi:hypothetical protein
MGCRQWSRISIPGSDDIQTGSGAHTMGRGLLRDKSGTDVNMAEDKNGRALPSLLYTFQGVVLN